MPKLGLAAILLSLAILGILVALIHPQRVVAALQGVSLLHVLAGLALVELQIVLSAWRWRFTAARLGQQLPLSLAIREYFVGSLLNQSLPGGMAGDALRAYRGRAGHNGDWKRPAQAVLMERLSGQLAFFILMAAGVATWLLLVPGELPPGFGVVAGTFLVLALLTAAVTLFLRRGSWGRHIAWLRPDLAAVFWRDGAFRVQFGCSAAIVASYVAAFAIASDAVGAPLPPVATITAVPLCLMAMLIPAGIGGWGSREAAAAALWPLFGYSAAQGLSASLLYGVLSLAGALPGLFILAHAAVRRRLDRAT